MSFLCLLLDCFVECHLPITVAEHSLHHIGAISSGVMPTTPSCPPPGDAPLLIALLQAGHAEHPHVAPASDPADGQGVLGYLQGMHGLPSSFIEELGISGVLKFLDEHYCYFSYPLGN